MDEILFLVVIVFGSALAVVVTAIVAFRRTTEHRSQIEGLHQQLNATVDRLAALEQVVARRAAEKHAAPGPSVASPMPVAPQPPAEAPPVVVPPPVSPPPAVRPPVVIDHPPIVQPLPPVFETPRASERPAPPPVEPLPPAAPNPFVAWFLRGNPLAKVGVVLLFIGLSFLLKFANDRGMLPIELRLSAAAIISMGLLAFGWRLRHRLPVYALTLQGGSIGALYLTCFAAFRFYSLLPHGLVFALLVVICAASVALAVLQRAQSLALLASLGGYLAPILLSTGAGNHVALFSYYGLLSAGILAVSIWKAWRPLNLIGFAFTFGIGAMWGAEHYQPALYTSCQIFLALNLLIYGVLAVLMALRHSDSTTAALVDGTLAFGTPLVGFGLQVGLTRHWEYGPAFSALAFGALYLPLAFFTMRRWPERGRRMTLSFLALGAGFVTLAIPLALSARWTSMAWALEGVGVLWAGRTQRNRRMTWSGTLLLALAAGSAWLAWMDGVDTPTFIMLSATLALSWLAAARLWLKLDEANEHTVVSNCLLVGSMAVWLILVGGGSFRLVQDDGRAAMLALVWMSASAMAWKLAGGRMQWRLLAHSAVLLWPVAALILPIQLLTDQHPLGTEAWSAAWGITLLAMWQILRLSRSDSDRGGQPVLHALFVWMAFALSAIEVYWRLDGSGWGAEEWPLAGLLTTSAVFVLIVSMMSRRQHWAVAAYPRTYWFGALVPVGVTAVALLLWANLLDGRVPGLPYLPLLNILEEPAAFTLLMAGVWQRAVRRLASRPVADLARDAILALVIWWVNGVLLRTLALIGGVGWSFDALWESAFIQTSMAIAWTAAALICMWVAARNAKRAAWFAGAVALGLVVVKLFAVDSARGGGLGRAVAFIGVAILILLIGYVAPLPPRQAREDSEKGGAS